MTTETDLIAQFSALSVDARAVLAAIVTYGTANQDVTIDLSNGFSITIQSIPKQVAQYLAQFNADKLNFYKDFGGAVTAETITRDATTGLITSILVTLAGGWQMNQVYTRFTTGAQTGRIQTIAYTLTDNVAVVQFTATRTLNYNASGQLASIS